MFNKILVPVDGSELSETSIPLASAIARDTGADVVIATVVSQDDDTVLEPPATGVEITTAGEQARRAADHRFDPGTARAGAEHYAKSLAAQVSGGNISVTSAVAVGDPATELDEIARRENADLIIIASRGRSGLVRGLLGSVTDRLIQVSDSPVLVVRPETAPATDEEYSGIETIVVPLDGSGTSEQALPHAIHLARASSASLLLVRCVRYPTMYASDHAGGDLEGTLVSMTEMEETAEQYLAAKADEIRENGLEVNTRVSAGHPRNQISEAATEVPGALIVLTSHGASGVTRWVLGSVADGLIRTAPVPTMVIPMRKPA